MKKKYLLKSVNPNFNMGFSIFLNVTESLDLSGVELWNDSSPTSLLKEVYSKFTLGYLQFCPFKS